MPHSVKDLVDLSTPKMPQTKKTSSTNNVSKTETNFNYYKGEPISDFLMHLLTRGLDKFLCSLWNNLFGECKSCDSGLGYH